MAIKLLLSDFSNMFRVFIGAGYFAFPFAFSQSGVALGWILIVSVVILNDHCFRLLIKCKKLLVHRLCCKYSEELVANHEKRPLTQDQIETEVFEYGKRLHNSLTFGDIGEHCFPSCGRFLVEALVVFLHFTNGISYFIVMGNSLQAAILPGHTSPSPPTNHSDNESALLSFNDASADLSTAMQYQVSSNPADVLISTFPPSNLSNSTPFHPTPSPSHFPTRPPKNMDIKKYPTLRLEYFMLMPLLPCCCIALIKKVRQFTPLLVGANVFLLTAFVTMYAYVLSDIDNWNVHFDNFRWETSPVTLAQMVIAFEGIAMVVPTHASMEGTRHVFSRYVHICLFLVGALYGSFGTFGYIRYGKNTPQYIARGVVKVIWIEALVNSAIVGAMLCSFAFGVHPLLEIVEAYLFLPGRIFGPPKDQEMIGSPPSSDPETEPVQFPSESDPLLPHSNRQQVQVSEDESEIMPNVLRGSASIPSSVAMWKRNIVRIILVFIFLALAIPFRNQFSYFLALLGSIGGAPLAYTLPCFFNLLLTYKNRTPRDIVITVKNSLIIFFSVIACVLSTYVTLTGMIQDMQKPH